MPLGGNAGQFINLEDRWTASRKGFPGSRKGQFSMLVADLGTIS